MNPNLVEVKSYDGEGFQPLVVFESWRVAMLNDCPEKYRRETLEYVERHRETDEIFVLLSGECTLLIGGNGDAPAQLEALPMEPFKVYNVRKGVWHNLLGQPGMRLFLVENADVSLENSDRFTVTPDMLP